MKSLARKIRRDEIQTEAAVPRAWVDCGNEARSPLSVKPAVTNPRHTKASSGRSLERGILDRIGLSGVVRFDDVFDTVEPGD